MPEPSAEVSATHSPHCSNSATSGQHVTNNVPIIPSFLYHLRHHPVGTITIPEAQISKDAVPVPDVPLNDENVPYFLSYLQQPEKFDSDLPGFTVVPNDVFWKITSSPSSEKTEEDLSISRAAKMDGATMARHQDLVDENFEVSLMFASKPLVQAFTNPFIGPISNK
ncbi:synaptic vesicular amine transporter [Nephila pilipes]|uniref:Synaptic vesicular amine transporter n=1 Tax=Nephila pilipes TaxID=299642 RepID=A0A8X6TUZ3_NEPPI|nr:synaptic vesicular amine transporter [Nephila pilipes]